MRRNVRPRPAPAWGAALGLVLVLLSTVAVAADSLSVPVGVKIPVALGQTISSQTAHRGDSFSFVTTKDENLGGIDVPSGTPGSGRIAAVTAATKGHNGNISLQADMLKLSGDRIVWVNVGPTPLKGHYAVRHVFPYVIPIPPVILPGAYVSRSGDLILDKGTAFTVVTTAPRQEPAPLVTPQTPMPLAPASPAPT